MINITSALENLNANHTMVTNLIPTPYNFSDDCVDGGDDFNSYPLGDVVFKQNDGKILWGGQSGLPSINYDFGIGSQNYVKNNIVRYNSDGTLDNTFYKAWFRDSNDSGYIRDIDQQSNGKIIVVGHFFGAEDIESRAIIRLNADGTVDNTFNSGSGFSNHALCCKVLNDDSILVGGTFATYDGTSSPYLAKLNSDGTINTSFASNIDSLSIGNQVHSLAVDNSGKIYIGGIFNNKIKRLNSDGTEDSGYNVGSGFSNGDGNNPRVSSIAIQSNGKIVVGHWFKNYNGSSCNPYITRFNDDGTVDGSFATDGTGFNYRGGSVQTVAIQPSNGKIIVGGWFDKLNDNPQNCLARLNTDGTLDDTFAVSTSFYKFSDWGGRVQSVALDSDENVYVASDLFSFKGNQSYGFTKISPTGEALSLDCTISYDPDVVFTDLPMGNKSWKQADGKILIAGETDRYDEAYNLMRLNADGTIDTTFKTFFSNNMVRDVKQQSNGKIIVGGWFDRINGLDRRGLARLNTDGTVDETFNTSDGFNGNVFSFVILSDDKIWVGGDFSSFDGNGSDKLVKLTADGDYDTASTANIDNTVFAVAEYPTDNKILVGGRFTKKIKMINSDGSEDSSFNVGSGFGNGIGNNPRVSSFAVQNDGKVIVGHWFTIYDGNPCSPGISRLNTDGTLDNSFATDGSGLYDSRTRGIVQSVALQADGKVLVAGWFNEYNGNVQRNLIRLNSNGTLDTSFDIGVGFDMYLDVWGDIRVNDVMVDSDGYVYCSGAFGSYQRVCRWAFVKIKSTGEIDTDFVDKAFATKTVGILDSADSDMYDGANYINTNLTQLYDMIKENRVDGFLSLPYTHSAMWNYDNGDVVYYPSYESGQPYDSNYAPVPNGEIKDGSRFFGSGSTYFTNMYQGMFVMMATDVSISEFSITGNIGSDGSGIDAVAIFPISSGGQEYTAYLKTNCCASDPSINHIIIVPGGPTGITQLYDDTGSYDDHCLQGLDNIDQIFYILVSRAEAAALSEEDATKIAKMFLDVLNNNFSQTYRFVFSQPNGSTEDSDGNLDTAIVNGHSIQRGGYIETVNGDSLRKVSVNKDGEEINDVPQTIADVLGIVQL